MRVKDVVNTVNSFLNTVYNAKTNYVGTTSVIGMIELRNMIYNLIGINYNICINNNKLYMYGTNFVLNTRRKKIRYKGDNVMTIVAVELVNSDIQEMTVHDVYEAAQKMNEQKLMDENNRALDFKNNLENHLKQYNMSLVQFTELYKKVRDSDYNTRNKLGL